MTKRALTAADRAEGRRWYLGMAPGEGKSLPPQVQQVGGSHYGTAKVGHWDLMEVYDIAYLEGNATKYLARWRSKGTPVQDLQKARSYLQKMGGRPTRRVLPSQDIFIWAQENEVPEEDCALVIQVLGAGLGTSADVANVIEKIDKMIEEASK